MNKSIFKIVANLFIFEIIYLIVSKIVFVLFPHQVLGWIYYININLYFLIAVFIWINFKLSDLHKTIIVLQGILFSIIALFSIFALFTINFEHTFRYIYYFIMNILFSSIYMMITLHIFFITVSADKSNKKSIVKAIIFTLLVVLINYLPPLVVGNYINDYERLFKFDYYIYILNFSFLVVFWQQYTHNKLIFSEYLANILLVHTIIIAMKIFHIFSFQNNLIFHFFSQYFNAILNIIMLLLWIARLYYLYSPESKFNEHYIANYNILHGFIDKPRKGLILALYAYHNRSIGYIVFPVIITVGIVMFVFNNFQIFVKLNILILMLALIISTIMAVIYWQKRWHETIGFFFIKRGK
jgi:hypothetical protein